MGEVILVLGEKTWKNSSGCTFYCENSFINVNLKYEDNKGLFYLNSDFLWVKVDGIIWRGQFEKEQEEQKYLLEIINFSGVPCINHPTVTLNYSSNLSMYSALLKAKTPVLRKQVLSYGKSSLDFIDPIFPCVLKIGNYHMGYGKSFIKNNEVWRDNIDMTVLLNEAVTIEPYVNYKIDIRCHYIGGQMKCMERKPRHWKANVCPIEVTVHTPPKKIIEITSNFAELIKADIIGMDWVMDEKGDWYILECNTSPGLIDYEEECCLINKILLEKIRAKV